MNTLMAPAWVSRMRLAGDILIAGRHPRVAEDAAHGVSQTTVLWTGTHGTLPARAFPSTKYVHQTTGVHNPDGRFWDRRRRSMARRQLLTDEERRLLLGVPR